MRPLTARQVETYLRKAGYRHTRTEGSHFIWSNEATGHAVAVPHHGNRTLKQGLLNSIFNACGIEKPQR